MNQRAMTPAERKRKQRERQSEDIAVKPVHEWTEAECLMVLSGTAWAAARQWIKAHGNSLVGCVALYRDCHVLMG